MELHKYIFIRKKTDPLPLDSIIYNNWFLFFPVPISDGGGLISFF